MNYHDELDEIDPLALESWELGDETGDPWSGETSRRGRPALPLPRRALVRRPLRRPPPPRPRPRPWSPRPLPVFPVAYPVSTVEPAGYEPAPPEPAAYKPAASAPAASEPAAYEPRPYEPAAYEPTASEPAPSEPEPSEPASSEPRSPAAEPSEPEPVASEAGAAASRFFKDSSGLQRAALSPASPVRLDPQWPSIRRQIGGTFNRVGGLMRAVARQVRIEPAAALAVWYVESAGRAHTPGQALIRFENHLLYRRWGKTQPALYNRHFRHGGHQGEPGQPWQNHKFRESPNAPFRTFHGNQALEYKALELASRLAGREVALSCISIGGPQILISNHAMIGYPSGQAMYEAFQKSERWHVLGFFDFCRHRPAPRRGDMFVYLRGRNWRKFARYYNGPGQIAVYGGRIGNADGHARAIGA